MGTRARTRRFRLLTVLAGAGAALAVWALAELAFGIRLHSPAFEASGATFEISPPLVVTTALVPALAGWALLALLERLTSRAAQLWLAIALLALAASLSMPLSGSGLDAAQRVALVAMHLAVGAAVVPTLYGSARRTAIASEESRDRLHAA